MAQVIMSYVAFQRCACVVFLSTDFKQQLCGRVGEEGDKRGKGHEDGSDCGGGVVGEGRGGVVIFNS